MKCKCWGELEFQTRLGRPPVTIYKCKECGTTVNNPKKEEKVKAKDKKIVDKKNEASKIEEINNWISILQDVHVINTHVQARIDNLTILQLIKLIWKRLMQTENSEVIKMIKKLK